MSRKGQMTEAGHQLHAAADAPAAAGAAIQNSEAASVVCHIIQQPRVLTTPSHSPTCQGWTGASSGRGC
jgi:hypothetical protein